jgi:hypothetical protein
MYINSKYREIYDATEVTFFIVSPSINQIRMSLVFFGTPHRGGDNTLVSLASIATHVARKLHV